jgi:V8-like Glu-specific endopeptidase
MRVRVAIALAALAVPMLLPGAAGASSAQAAAKAEHDRIASYWTAERMAAAKHKDYVRNEQGKLVPFAKPTKPGGGGSGGAVVGASWTGNGAIEVRSGKLYFSTTGGNWQCTASVISDASTSNGYSTILTAGHCTYDGSEGWSTNVMYIPDFDDAPTGTCSQTVYGCWTATKLAINSDFYPSGFGPDAALRVDYGVMKMGLGGKSGTAELDAVTGGYTLKTSGVGTSDTQWAFGYPAAGKYHAKDLIYCKGSTINDPNGVGTWGMACNMTGGSSGGPWLTGTTNPADGSGQLSSLNSYGYQGLTYMFGPRFTSETSTVAGDAIDGSATSGVSVTH